MELLDNRARSTTRNTFISTVAQDVLMKKKAGFQSRESRGHHRRQLTAMHRSVVHTQMHTARRVNKYTGEEKGNDKHTRETC